MKKNTSDRLKELMQLRGIKQIDIINMCKNNPYGIKLNKSDLSQYVSGKFLPKQDKLTLLAYALNVSESWLMGYDVPMEKIDDKMVTMRDIAVKKSTELELIIEKINFLNHDKLTILKKFLYFIDIADYNEINQIESYINFLKSQKKN